MTEAPDYTARRLGVEKVYFPNWRYGHLNRPIAGATHDKVLPRAEHIRRSVVGDA